MQPGSVQHLSVYKCSIFSTGPESFSKDFNLLYWSSDVRTVEASSVRGKCYVLPKSAIKGCSVQEWTAKGVHRFYYESQYDKAKDSVCDELSEEAQSYRTVITVEKE